MIAIHECRRHSVNNRSGIALPHVGGFATRCRPGAGICPCSPPKWLARVLRDKAGPAPAPTATHGAWRAAMTFGGYRYGDAVPDYERSPAAIGIRDLHPLGKDEAMFVGC